MAGEEWLYIQRPLNSVTRISFGGIITNTDTNRVSNDSGGDRDGNRMRKKKNLFSSLERNKRFELEASYNRGTADMEFE